MQNNKQSGFTHVGIVLLGLIVILIGVVGWRVVSMNSKNAPNKSKIADETFATQELSPITNFNECLTAGYPVSNDMPRKCVVDGKTYTDESQQDEITKQNLLLYKQVTDYVSSQPVTYTGNIISYDKYNISLKETNNTKDFYFSEMDRKPDDPSDYVYLVQKSPDGSKEWYVAGISQFTKGEQYLSATNDPLGKIEDIFAERSDTLENFSDYYIKRGNNYYILSFGNGGSGCYIENSGLIDIPCFKEYDLINRDIKVMFKSLEQN